MKLSTDELLTRLAEHADWCDANEWEIPINMGQDIREAILVIVRLYLLSSPTASGKSMKGNDVWKYVGIDIQTHEYPEAIWECRRCGYQRLAGWTPPYYNCPECTGRDQNTQKDGTTHD